MKILFLYTELAQYFLSSVRHLVEKKNVEVHIIRWPVNQEAPFRLASMEKVTLYDRNDMNDREMKERVRELKPDMILASGWIDKGYLAICHQFYGSIPTVLILDNQWRGTWKQYLAILGSRFRLLNRFSHAWVPGAPQKTYARKLGFPDENIRTGFYCADISSFYQCFERFSLEKKTHFPHRFLYVGRYVRHKGIFDMWEAFLELKEETANDWELWCLGTGDQYEQRMEGEGIRHFGFVQPSEMEEFIRKTGVFLFPSNFEPWGVAVHEFASAGFPLLCSDVVGAATRFLEDGKNGYLFRSGDKASLKAAMQKIMTVPDEECYRMGEHSASLAMELTPDRWTETLLSFFQEHQSA